MNTALIERAIENATDWDSIRWKSDGTLVTTIEVDGTSLDVIKVDDFGGEGQGEKLWVVVKIDGKFYRKSGYYSSYDGSEWDGPFREVSPVQKTITVYEAR